MGIANLETQFVSVERIAEYCRREVATRKCPSNCITAWFPK